MNNSLTLQLQLNLREQKSEVRASIKFIHLLYTLQICLAAMFFFYGSFTLGFIMAAAIPVTALFSMFSKGLTYDFDFEIEEELTDKINDDLIFDGNWLAEVDGEN
ncbi:MAG: hypothetical protein GC193_09025 [Cryomorphaceae bacterium]|nr:hypothetical protein [Cryomorphaceae bacterium]